MIVQNIHAYITNKLNLYTVFRGFSFQAPIWYLSQIKTKSRPIWSQLHTGTILEPGTKKNMVSIRRVEIKKRNNE